MSNSLRGVAIAAAAMVTAGILLTGIGFMMGGNQPVYLDEKGIHVGGQKGSGSGHLEYFALNTENFSSIEVDLDYYDVDLMPGDKFAIDGKFYSQDGMPDVKVENDTLIVKSRHKNRVNLNIDFPDLFANDNQPRVTIYYPEKTELKNLVIKCDASDLSFENLTAEKANFELDLGKLDLKGLSAKSINVSMDSGDCSLSGIKSDDLKINNDLGKISLDGAETKNLRIDADSGEVVLTDVTADHGEVFADLGRISGKNLTTGGLKVESNSGEVNLEGKLSGLTDISSDMGAVTVSPGAPKDQFNYELKADMGSVSVGGDHVNGSVISNSGTAENTLRINTDMGSITVNFED